MKILDRHTGWSWIVSEGTEDITSLANLGGDYTSLSVYSKLKGEKVMRVWLRQQDWFIRHVRGTLWCYCPKGILFFWFIFTDTKNV